MARLLLALHGLLGVRRSDLPGYGRAHLHRDLGMDDWEGSIGTARPDRLWPATAPRDYRVTRHERSAATGLS